MGGTVIGSLHFWLRLSLALLSLLSLSLRLLSSGEKPNATDAINTAPLHRAGKLTSPLIFALLWFIAGCTFMDYEFNQTIKEKKDVLIVARRSENRFTIFSPTNDNGESELVTCAAADFQPGEKLKFLKYEQQETCSNIRGPGRGFKAYKEKNGQRTKFPIPMEIADGR